MKIKKRIIIPIAAILVVGVAATYTVQVSGSKPQITTVDTYAVEVTDLANTIPVTGMVESDESTSVYSTLSYPIDTVEVEVGDVVAEGDVLCQLDTTALEYTIAQSQATLNAAQVKANHSVELAKKAAETNKNNVEEDYDTVLLNAESAVKTAENTLLSSQHNTADIRKELRELRSDRRQVPDGEFYDDYIEAKQKELVQAEISMERAQQALEDAQQALRAAQQQSRDKQVSDEDAITTAELNTNFNDQYIAIQKLQSDLADATITAPVSGTITAVYAKEGSAGTGLLFVIENTDSLKVVTKIKEYDIGMVTEGLPVTIKSDATGDEEFEGVISMISPTTLKDATGNTVDTTSAEFSTEVKVTSASKLRIGMNARLSIITEQKQNVMTVPYESIATDDNGDTFVYIMDPQEDGTSIAKKVPVTPGMETDFYSEITGSELKEGDLVIANPAGIEEGMLVRQLDELMIQQALLD